jgi:hypothetical protein
MDKTISSKGCTNMDKRKKEFLNMTEIYMRDLLMRINFKEKEN